MRNELFLLARKHLGERSLGDNGGFKRLLIRVTASLLTQPLQQLGHMKHKGEVLSLVPVKFLYALIRAAQSANIFVLKL